MTGCSCHRRRHCIDEILKQCERHGTIYIGQLMRGDAIKEGVEQPWHGGGAHVVIVARTL